MMESKLYSISSAVYTVLSLLFVWFISDLVLSKFKPGLSNIPGPWLASFTDLWRLNVAWGRRPEVTHQELHAKYGDVVRLGPNMISVSDLKAVKEIYSYGTAYVKSDFYPVQRPLANGQALQSIFTATDNTFHAKIRKGVIGIFSMSTVAQYESLVDSTITTFIDQLDQRYVGKHGEDGICDFSSWLSYFAFDVIGEIAFSERLGFLESASDVEDIIKQLEVVGSYFSIIGQMPWLDKLLMKNPIKRWMSANGIGQKLAPMPAIAIKRIRKRVAAKASGNEHSDRALDVLDRVLLLSDKDPAFYNDKMVLSLMAGTIFGGADTTAITMRTIFYHLLKSPHTIEGLLAELAEVDYASDDGIARWSETRNLPYLNAVIQEALRIHPPVGLPLERVVPASGLQVGQYFLPPGTVVGTSAWVLHQKESIFGAKCREFRPERWIEATEKQKSVMNSAMFSFGMGSKECLGRSISYLEIYKLIPTLLRRYKFSLADPKAEWQISNAFFIKQTGIYVEIQRRSEGQA